MANIECIPYDIWQLIFENVCTDGGYSGCSLARTSKAFRTLSASTRFHSLTLSSLSDVKRFLACLERIRRSERARNTAHEAQVEGTDPDSPYPIHHLLLSFLPETCDAPQRVFRKWTDYARDELALVYQLANDHKTWALQKKLWNCEFILRVSRLLQIAAPTLRSLAVLQCGEIRLPLVHYHRPFPLLRELTLLADDRMFLRVPGPGVLVVGQNDPSDFDYAYDLPENPPFPALTHMHVIFSGPKLHPWHQTLPLWHGIAPSVRHLRISQGSPRVPHLLGEMLEVPGTLEDEDGGQDQDQEQEPEHILEDPPQKTDRPYPSLRRVIVQMSSARKTRDGDPALRELQRIADILELDWRAPRVAILQSRTYMPGYWEGRLAWEWRSRMEGGGGCWTEDEEHEYVWKDFHHGDSKKKGSEGKRSKRARSERSLNDQVSGEKQGRKWWKVLANGMPGLNRIRSLKSVVA